MELGWRDSTTIWRTGGSGGIRSWSSAGRISVLFGAEDGAEASSSAGGMAVLFGAEDGAEGGRGEERSGLHLEI